MKYYSDVFTEATWRAFLAAGARVTGFSQSKRTAASRVEPGDYLLCYLRRRFEWVGLLTATSRAYDSQDNIWSSEDFPVRVNVEPVALLQPQQGVHINDLVGRLSFFPAVNAPNWGSHLQGSPRPMVEADGRAVMEALLARAGETSPSGSPEDSSTAARTSNHWQIQASLAQLGLAMGCQVWTPKSDRLRVANLMDARRILDALPVVFGGAAQQTVGNIDVVWFRGATIIAAFEIEHSTSIYSGLLRMSDLASVFPNVAFPVFIVAADERRYAVQTEITRPTFARLNPPLAEFCRFLSYEKLEAFVAGQSAATLRYLDPLIISTIAEAFTVG